MTSVFENAGFVPYKAPQTTEKPKTDVQQQPAAAKPVTPADITKPSNDTFALSEPIDKNKLKEELRAEILEEIKQENLAKEAEKEKENKPGPVKGFKRFIGNIKKLGTTIAEYTKGLFKGVFKGGIIGGALFGTLYGFGKSKLFDNTKLLQKPIAKKMLKGKYTAPIVGGIVLAANIIGSLWNASIKANEKRALIEHKWENTPVVR